MLEHKERKRGVVRKDGRGPQNNNSSLQVASGIAPLPSKAPAAAAAAATATAASSVLSPAAADVAGYPLPWSCCGCCGL